MNVPESTDIRFLPISFPKFRSASCFLWLLTGCLISIGQQYFLSAEDGTAQTEEALPLPISDSPTIVKERPGVLLLRSLEVVDGIIVPDQGVYRVRSSVGELVVPSANVLFESGSREEAYLLLKHRVIPNNPEDHVSLAKWCARNELYEDAVHEMEIAVKLSANNMEYRYLLKQANELRNPYHIPSTTEGSKPDRFDLSSAMLQRVEPLGGMTREQAKMFTSRVQPILVNGCGTAQCHQQGNDKQLSWTLSAIGNHQSLSRTRSNFESILPYLDTSEPDKSLLLTVHRESADNIESPFDKPHGNLLEQTVRDWIASLGMPDKEREIPDETGIPATANIVSAITRDRARYERRQQLANKRRQYLAKEHFTNKSEGNYLDQLLTEETKETAESSLSALPKINVEGE